MTAPLWTLYNNKTEQSIEGLTRELAIEKMRLELDSELQFWFVWYEGLANWEPILTHPEFSSLKAAPTESAQVDEESHLEKTQIDYDPHSDIQEIEQIADISEVKEVAAVESEVVEAPEVTVTAERPLPTVSFDDEDPAIHIFWMADSSEQDPSPAHLGKMSADYAAAHPTRENTITGVRSIETEHFEDAVQMPEDGKETPAPAIAKDTSGRERRQFERYDIRYRVIVRNENLTFRTFSKNISLGGVALEMPVPEAMLGSDCQIYVGNPRTGENIRFSGKLVPNRSEAKYFLFLQASAESLMKLQKWVEAHTAKKSA